MSTVALPMPVAPSTSVMDVMRNVRARWAPQTRLKVSEFSDAEIVVATGPLAGTRWQTDFAPYQRGILDAVHEGAQFIVVMGSSQWGKTACAVNIVSYHIAHDPCGIMVVEPTETPMAKDFAKNRLDPTIRSSPALQRAVDKRRQPDASNTTLMKTFRGGFLVLAGANSAASLAARAVRVLVLDEVDRYERTLGEEGDTIEIAIKRTNTFKDRKRVIMLSSPTMVDAPIDAWFKRGDRRRYWVPCPSCATMHPLMWGQVRWEHDDPTTARLHCPACDHPIDEAERVAILARGEWRADERDPDEPPRDSTVISFHLWEAYSPLSSLAEIVRSFLRARQFQRMGDPGPMHTWQNTTLGEPVEPDLGEGVEPVGLLLRRESFGSDDVDLPQGVCCLTMGVDTQDDRLEAVVVGWGVDEESWIVDRQTFPGDTSQPDPWRALEQELLSHEYRHASGRRMGIRATAIDTAGHRTSTVYHYAALWAARRVYAIIGRGGQQSIVSSPSPRRYGQGERHVGLYTVGVDAAKALLISRLQLTDKGVGAALPGYIHLPASPWCDEEFVAQLTSERLKSGFERGQKFERWVKIRPRNEALDCYVYALAAFYQQQPDPKRRLDWLRLLAAELKTDPSTTPPPAPPPAPRSNPFVRPGRGWGFRR